MPPVVIVGGQSVVWRALNYSGVSVWIYATTHCHSPTTEIGVYGGCGLIGACGEDYAYSCRNLYSLYGVVVVNVPTVVNGYLFVGYVAL